LEICTGGEEVTVRMRARFSQSVSNYPLPLLSRFSMPRPTRRSPKRDVSADVAYALEWLEKRGSQKNRDGMARYGIVAKKVYGVSMGTMKTLARELGKSHALSEALWKTGWYEARMLASMVGEPAKVTPTQMERWAKSFDNWAVCDTATFVLWDRSPHAWTKVNEWSKRDEEFVKRAAFAMLASLTVHDKDAPDANYLKGLKLIEREAWDDRNFVKKAVNWALRSIGKRNPALNKAAIAVAKRLAASKDAAPRWIGKDALREITSPAVKRRLERKGATKG
jgi:3-methyladenine DNA glycosylase AlkD